MMVAYVGVEEESSWAHPEYIQFKIQTAKKNNGYYTKMETAQHPIKASFRAMLRKDRTEKSSSYCMKMHFNPDLFSGLCTRDSHVEVWPCHSGRLGWAGWWGLEQERGGGTCVRLS